MGKQKKEELNERLFRLINGECGGMTGGPL